MNSLNNFDDFGQTFTRRVGGKLADRFSGRFNNNNYGSDYDFDL